MRKTMDAIVLDEFDFDAEPRNARVPKSVRIAFNKTPWKEGFVVAQSNGLVLALTREICIAEAALSKCMGGCIYTSSPLGHIYQIGR